MRRPSWVLLDRDGTINVKAPDGEYVTDPRDVRLLPGVGPAMKSLRALGLPVAVVTNQRGVARGVMTSAALAAVNRQIAEYVDEAGGAIESFYCCTHEIGACQCRKPLPGLLLQAERETARPLTEAAVIGDAESDVQAAKAVGAMAIRLGPATCETEADVLVPDLFAAVSGIADDRRPGRPAHAAELS